MPFIRKGMAFKLVNAMETGRCAGTCRSGWLPRIKYALKAKSNPLDLTIAEKRKLTAKIKGLKRRVTRKNRR
jgi:hypothetical protein